MKKLIEIQLDNGTTIYIETTSLDRSDDLQEQVSSNKIIRKTKSFLSETFSQIKDFSCGLADSINAMELKPDELEVQFGVKFSADAGIIISSVGTETNITIKMKWKTQKGS